MIRGVSPASSTPKLELIITESRHVVEIEGKLKQAEEQIALLETEITELTSKYGYESYLNNELLDVIRENHIPVRPGLLKHS